jgi:hypothetical protein
MTTYATLKSDITEYMARSDITDALKATFVRLAEAEIRRSVRIGAMEVTDTSFAVSNQSTALPTGFIAMRSLSNNTQNKREMDYLPPARLRSSKVMDIGSQTPTAYTIEGTNLVVAPSPSAGTTLTMVYYKAFDALSADSDTNVLLSTYYDVYLYGALRAAAEWALEPDAEGRYTQKFLAVIEQTNQEERWSRVSGSALFRTGGMGTP